LVNGGFFGNISNTIQLMKSCVKVLRKDRELILFPIMAAIFVLLLLGLIYSRKKELELQESIRQRREREISKRKHWE